MIQPEHVADSCGLPVDRQELGERLHQRGQVAVHLRRDPRALVREVVPSLGQLRAAGRLGGPLLSLGPLLRLREPERLAPRAILQAADRILHRGELRLDLLVALR